MSGPVEQQVVLLGADHRPVGAAPKGPTHHADTPLHLAFSVYAFDPRGRFLATRRALTKQAWAGVWTNTCCGHPAPGEELADAARRRLGEELGLVPATLDLLLPNFGYRATSPEGVVENEFCPVFRARIDGDPRPAAAEVAQWQWVDWADFCAVAERAPWALSPWSVAQVAALRAAGFGSG